MNISKTPAIALALALAACGGGGSSSTPTTGGGATPTPTPTATPTPTPTPTSSITYTKYDDLSAAQTFQSACASLPRSGGSYIGAFATAFGEGLSFAYDPGAKSYRVTGDTHDLTFQAADIVFEDGNGRRYEKPNATSGLDYLSIYNPGFTVSRTEYARFGYVQTTRPDGQVDLYRCVLGMATSLSDPLPSGTKTYSQLFTVGNLFVVNGGSTQVSNAGASTVTFSANPATGAITLGIALKGAAGGTTTNFFDVTGSTTIDGSKQDFSGLLLDGSSTVVGQFGGWFFGPSGTEVGIVWSVNSRQPDGSDVLTASMTLGSNP